MPRVYKPKPGAKRYKKYDKQTIDRAVHEVLSNPNACMQEVAKKYDMSKSVLYRHYKRPMKQQGGQRALSADAEKDIAEAIRVCMSWGCSFKFYDFRQFIKIYLDYLGIRQNKFKDNLPSNEFIQHFLLRNKDTLPHASNSRNLVSEYFPTLTKTIANVPDENILSYLETSLCEDPRSADVILMRDSKYPDVPAYTKSSVSVTIACTASGEMLPPYVVYQASNVYDSWVQEGPEDARYNCTPSGWLDGATFGDWIKNIVLPYFKGKEGKKCLIGEQYATHMSAHVVDLCKSNNIHLVVLPANKTKFTHPLQNTFSLAMKNTWQQILIDWKETHDQRTSCVPKSCFPKLLKLLMDDLKMYSHNVKNGFRKTGIIPLNPRLVMSKLHECRTTQTPNQTDIGLELESNDSEVTEDGFEIKPNINSEDDQCAGENVCEKLEITDIKEGSCVPFEEHFENVEFLEEDCFVCVVEEQ